MEDVSDDQGLENIELEMSIASTDGHSHVVTHDLGAAHSEGLTLSRVDLSWHNRRAWLVLGKRDLTEATSWTRSEEPDIIGNFHERYRNSVEGSAEMD